MSLPRSLLRKGGRLCDQHRSGTHQLSEYPAIAATWQIYTLKNVHEWGSLRKSKTSTILVIKHIDILYLSWCVKHMLG